MNCLNCGQEIKAMDEHHAVKGYTCKTNDTRYCYGATCTWHGPIDSVGRMPTRKMEGSGLILPGGLPCCPHCQGPLFEVPSKEDYFKGAQKFEDKGNPDSLNPDDRGPFPGYVTLTEYLASCGTCFSLKRGFMRILVAVASGLILEKRLSEAAKKLRDAEDKS